MTPSAYEACFRQLNELGLAEWVQQLRQVLPERLAADVHGLFSDWHQTLAQLPAGSDQWTVNHGLKFHVDSDVDFVQLQKTLLNFHPWRKGPIFFGDLDVDTEWRSDWKWERIAPHVEFRNRSVLDIGCGNGYFGWRCLDAGAKSVLGIDPFLLFVAQHFVFKHFAPSANIDVLPLADDDLPERPRAFDVVLSMGVLYHRSDPIQHLKRLRFCARPGGTVVLETLIVEGSETTVLVPEDRYAMMRNVWFLPSIPLLQRWLRRTGFQDIQVVDITKTTIQEQRSTNWMTFDSLPDFLDPNDHNRTQEGYPAPLRACLVMKSP